MTPRCIRSTYPSPPVKDVDEGNCTSEQEEGAYDDGANYEGSVAALPLHEGFRRMALEGVGVFQQVYHPHTTVRSRVGTSAAGGKGE